jgi:hypothetical protein
MRPAHSLRFIGLCLVALALIGSPAIASGGGHGGGDASSKPKSPAKRQITTLKSWVDVDPLTVSIIHREGVRGTFMVGFGMDVPDDALRASAEALLPRLRNNWLIAINHFAATQLRPKTQADLDAITLKLQQIADQTLGKTGAKILLNNAIVNFKP